MHNLDIYRLLFDFGFMVLIWTVQLIVYPGFRYRSPEDLIVWHRIYSVRITIILMPLFFGQFLISMLQLWQYQTYYSISSFAIIVLLWLITILVFVPIHKKISAGSFDRNFLIKLDRLNWIRTMLWTILCVSSFWNLLI
jgi:hypothetical protein